MKSNLEPEALSRKDQTGDGARSKEMVGGGRFFGGNSDRAISKSCSRRARIEGWAFEKSNRKGRKHSGGT